jgi:hypothetical protein
VKLAPKLIAAQLEQAGANREGIQGEKLTAEMEASNIGTLRENPIPRGEFNHVRFALADIDAEQIAKRPDQYGRPKRSLGRDFANWIRERMEVCFVGQIGNKLGAHAWREL